MLNDTWRARLTTLYSLGIGGAGWYLLLAATWWGVLRANLLPLLAFTALSLVIKRLGLHVARDVTHSLVGVVDLAAVFAFGPAIGAWVGALSGGLYLSLRAAHHRRLSWRSFVEHPLFSSGLKALMALGCGAVYLRLGGTIAPATVTWQMLPPLLATLGIWFILDHVAWGFRAFLRAGWPGVLEFVRASAAYSIMVELLPLPLSIVIALSYGGMGEPIFVLLSLALVASGALLQRLMQVWQRLETKLAELDVLNEFGRALVGAQLNEGQLHELIYTYCSRVVDAPIFLLELTQTELGRVQVVTHVEHGRAQPRRELPMTETVKWMASSRQPFLSTNMKVGELPFEPHIVGELPRSLLMVPLLAADELIGVLSLQSLDEGAFDQDDLSILATMANQAAIAISNARAYEAEQRRARQLATVHEVSRRVTSILGLDNLLSDVVNLIRDTFHYDHVAVFTVDPETASVEFRASTNASIHRRGLEVWQGEGIVRWVAEFGEHILANDVADEPRFWFADVLEETQAELAVPLKVEQRVVGVLDVQSNTRDAFQQDDLFVLQTLADQIAIAVEQASLYAARQEEAWSSTALLEVAEALGDLDNLEDILNTVTRVTPMLVGVDRCSILLWHDETQELSYAQGYTTHPNLQRLFESTSFRPGDSPILDPLLGLPSTAGGDAQPNMAPEQTEGPDSLDAKNLLVLPLVAQSELQGVMAVDYSGPHAGFSTGTMALLSGIADRVGMAIANVRLHIAQREEAWVSTALLQVAQVFASSTDLKENLSKIARLTPLLVGVDRCLIFLRDEREGAFVPYQAHGLSSDLIDAFDSLHLSSREMPLIAEMANDVRYIVVEDAPHSDLLPSEFVRTFDVKSLLAVPMTSRGETTGLFLVDYTEAARHFSARNIGIVEGIARQAAMAVENARLYQATLEQERVAQELRVARDIQISFLPQECPALPGWEIAADWHAARGVGGDFYDFIPLDGENLGLVIADVSDKGVPAALFMSLSRTLVRVTATQTHSPAQALQRANQLIMRDTRSDMFLTLFYGILNWKTGMLTYANAGHNPPILWRCVTPEAKRPAQPDLVPQEDRPRAEGQPLTPHFVELSAKGIALGVVDEISLQERQISVEPGDLLILYTDGVTEPINEREEEFGEERLRQMIAQGCDQPCAEIVRRVRDAVAAFAGSLPQFDDYTLVCLRRKN